MIYVSGDGRTNKSPTSGMFLGATGAVMEPSVY